MSSQRVREYLDSKGFDGEIIRMPGSTATVDLAAQALGVEPERIAKTLALRQGEECVVLVVAGRARIDNKKYKAAFAVKAKMLGLDETAQETGHPVGGVCPFGLPADMKIYLDASLRAYDVVYPAAGETNACLRLTVEELEHLTGGAWVDVCCTPEV